MKFAFITSIALFTAFAAAAQDADKSTSQSSTTSSTSTGQTIVVDGKTNGIVIRRSVINGQPPEVDVQVIGGGAPGDLGARIAADVRAATQQALGAAGGAVDGLAQGFALALDDKDGFAWPGLPGRKGDRAVMVSAAPVDAKTRAEWQEDLNVMARLLEKAATQSAAGAKAHAMGIQLMMMGAGRPASHLYLEGYGAVIQINVPFALMAGAKKAEAKKDDPKPESEWDRTRRELYGTNRPNDPTTRALTPNEAFRREVQRQNTIPGGAYDAERVAKFKDALLEALKNAVNIRHLKRGENLTVVVTGPGDASTLTLTAPKSALDDLAKGRTSMDEFRKKHPVVIY